MAYITPGYWVAGYAAGDIPLTLAIADAAHSHTADNLGLSTTGSASLSVADSSHAHAAENLALATQRLLAIADALHAHVADNEVLDTSNAVWLTVQKALQAHAADSLGLSLQTWLAVADAVQAHYADAAVLSVPLDLTLTGDDVAIIVAALMSAIRNADPPIPVTVIDPAITAKRPYIKV